MSEPTNQNLIDEMLANMLVLEDDPIVRKAGRSTKETINLRRLRLYKYIINTFDDDDDNDDRPLLGPSGLFVVNVANTLHAIHPCTQRIQVSTRNTRHAYPFLYEDLHEALARNLYLDGFIRDLDEHFKGRNVWKLSEEISNHLRGFFGPRESTRDTRFSLVICAEVYRDVYTKEYLERIENGGVISKELILYWGLEDEYVNDNDMQNMYVVTGNDDESSADEYDYGPDFVDHSTGNYPFGHPKRGVEVSIVRWGRDPEAKVVEIEAMYDVVDDVDDDKPKENNVEIEECAICLEQLEFTKVDHENLVLRLKCGHCYHNKCILNWVVDHYNTCPYCRLRTVTHF